MAQRFIALIALCLLAALPAHAILPEAKQPHWNSLTAQQQAALAPLATDWDRLSEVQKKKLIGAAKRYPTMSSEQQQRFQSRLKEWAALTPEQRKQARQKYRDLSKLPPEKRGEVKQKWHEYSQRYQRKHAPQATPGGVSPLITPTTPATPGVTLTPPPHR